MTRGAPRLLAPADLDAAGVGVEAFDLCQADDVVGAGGQHFLVVFNNADESQMQVNLTRTNKEQEYLMSGMPIIVFGAPATAEYVLDNKVGLVFKDLRQLTPEILEKNYPALKQNVEELRPTLTMESHIHRLEQLIQEIL